MHFGVVLLVSAVLSAPWPALVLPALALGLCGLARRLYTIIVIRRPRRVDVYAPVVEDWLWYTICPLLAYLTLVVVAALLPSNPVPALFMIGGVVTLLLFNGIRNAWDIVTFIVIERLPQQAKRHERVD